MDSLIDDCTVTIASQDRPDGEVPGSRVGRAPTTAAQRMIDDGDCPNRAHHQSLEAPQWQ